MIRDHVAAKLQEAQLQIEDLRRREVWQRKNQKVDCLAQMEPDIKGYYEGVFKLPSIDQSLLPPYSFVLQFTFTLAQPYISRDEQGFYIIDNPVRKDKVFGLPYVAPTSWKGSLRAAIRQLGSSVESEMRLFGNEKGIEDHEFLHAGRLFFFPTFFEKKSLEIINPHDRVRRVGKNPILLESVPAGATGIFTLLYVPFDRVGEDEAETKRQVAIDLRLVAEGLQVLFCRYGFGAKTSSGFGTAEEIIAGSLALRAKGIGEELAQAPVPAPPAAAPQPAAPDLARYLEAPGRLKAEYRNVDGTFRERSEAELKQMRKADKQLYDKAKNWWEQHGKRLAEEAAQQPKPATPVASPPEPESAPKAAWPVWQFESFGELVERVEEVKQALNKGDVK
jgi:CRISPR-associated protein Cmr2